jgi:hypothetical protein
MAKGGYRMAAKKSASKKKSGYSSPKAKAKVGKVMHEFKHGQLKSGGKAKVKNPKQAIAIALSEARQAGADIPKKGAAKKKSAGAPKKGAAKKGTTKKAPARKTASKKTAAKKTTAKKTSSKKKSGAKRKS